MARFAQYYLEYSKDELFSEEVWMDRQQLFGAYFENDDSIEFYSGEGENRKIFKHNVYHLAANKDIIVMRIANDKTKEVIQDFKPVSVKHEPPCYVIIDNRGRCRRVAIQRNKESFNTTDSLRNIMQDVLGKKMRADHYLGIKLHAQFYPRDFYKAWRARQYSTACIRFNFGDVVIPDVFTGEELDDETIMNWAIKVNEEDIRSQYRTVLELNPPSHKTFLEVDVSSNYIRNLVKFAANTGSSIEIVTNDNSRFTCYIDNDEESDCIVTNEIDSDYLDVLFPEEEARDDEEVRKAMTAAEEKIVEFVNGMKVEAEEKGGKEKVA